MIECEGNCWLLIWFSSWWGMKRTKKPRQRTHVWCDCGLELISSGSFALDEEYVVYDCVWCGARSRWDFDWPVPMRVDISRLTQGLERYDE